MAGKFWKAAGIGALIAGVAAVLHALNKNQTDAGADEASKCPVMRIKNCCHHRQQKEDGGNE